ncbi:low temperature requirement protein A, partial [Streptomyces sp. SID10853]|uniref:low temperature requirement protein A n=1 Tax=Streptomyces sp. SID10853 TaxID=2706028 RepID=UPI0013C25288
MNDALAPGPSDPGPPPQAPPSGGGREEERHSSWLELFFDLIVVAGVGQLAHLLHGEPGPADLGLYALLFLAFWNAWILFTMYANVAGDRVRTMLVMAGMFGMAVMAAAVPGVRHHNGGAFALAYVLVRLLSSRLWNHRGEVIVDLPITRMGAGLAPWVVSVWVDGHARYVLWAAGIAIDLVSMFTGSAGRMLEQARKDREHRHRAPLPVARYADGGHLDERLGLFVLIVLGEAIVQMVGAAGEAVWDRALYGVAIGAFLLLLQFWSLSLRHGTGGVPLLGAGAVPVRIALVLHCFVAGSIAALAAALGNSVAFTDGRLPGGTRWLMCGAVAVYLVIAAVAASASGRGIRHVLVKEIPALAAVAALGLFTGGWPPAGVIWLLVAAVRWLIPWPRRRATRSDRADGRTGGPGRAPST